MAVFLKRIIRGILYVTRYYLLEKPRGLDFSMRDISTITLKGSSGYALTSKKAIFNVIKDLPITAEDSFIDIGSGKGGVPYFVCEKPFRRIAGLEYEEHLHQIAIKNIDRLKLNARIELIQGDARHFNGYGDFNYFFLFNPFDDDMYAEVISRIVSSFDDAESGEQRKYLLCYGRANLSAIAKTDYFELIREDVCPYRGNAINIFRSKKTG